MERQERHLLFLQPFSMEMDDVASGNVMDRGRKYGGDDNQNNWNEITLGDRKVISMRTIAANDFHAKSVGSACPMVW